MLEETYFSETWEKGEIYIQDVPKRLEYLEKCKFYKKMFNTKVAGLEKYIC